MLNTDMCLFYQDNSLHAKCMNEVHDGKTRNRKACKKLERKGKFLNAKTSQCCAWTQFAVLKKRGILEDEVYCGLDEKQMKDFKAESRKNARSQKKRMDLREELRG